MFAEQSNKQKSNSSGFNGFGKTQLKPHSLENVLQRKCACGGYSDHSGECEECKKKRLSLQRNPVNLLQPKLKISSLDDIYEKEADEIADKVMRMKIHEQDSTKIKSQRNEEGQLQRKEGSGEISPDSLSLVNEVINSSGKPLDEETRAFMEPRFGYDFSKVRIHDDNKAAESANAVNALAYTVGNNIVFNTKQFNSSSQSRKNLLAHELTHIIQQNESTIIQPMFLDIRAKREINIKPMFHKFSTLSRQQLPEPMTLPEELPMTMGTAIPSFRGQLALSIAIGEVGVEEIPAGSNRGACIINPPRRCVDAYTGSRSEPWCAHFVSWFFEQTGFSPFGHISSVNTLRSWARNQGWFVEQGQVQQGTYTPLAGDVFTMPRYQGSGPQRRLVGGHTGFVLRYDQPSGLLETVEGNTGDKVQMRSRSLTELDGFIRIGS